MSALLNHIKMAHGLAVGIDGKMILASYGEGIPNKVEHFNVGDYEAMAQCAERWSEEPARNVYMPLVVMRADLEKGLKGGEVDIIAVLGVVADFDDKDAKNWKKRLPLEPSYVYETSSGRFQAAYLFAKKLSVSEAKSIGKRLKAFSCCDHGTADMSHIWRLPDTKNYPNQKKVDEGRSAEPQTVKVVMPWNGTLTDTEELSRLLPEISDSVIELENNDFISEIDLEELPEDLKYKIVNGVEQGQRSDTFYHVICVLQKMRFSIDAAHSLLAAYPNGVAYKYAERGDLRSQVEKCYSKALASSAVCHDFTSLPPEYIEKISKQKKPLRAKLASSSSFISVGEATWQDSGIPLYKYFMNRETVVVVYGPSNSGKSFLVLDYALHLAAGLDWVGYKCKEKMAVLYICAESGATFGRRVVAARRKLGLSENVHLHEIPFAYYNARLDLLNNKEHLQKIEKLIDELEEQSGHKCGLVVIDTLSASFGGGNENSEDMTRFVNNMADIKFNKKVTPLIVHHTGKDENAGARGHSSLKCNIDTEIKVKVINDNKGTFQSTKQRDDEKGKASQFCRTVVSLGLDDDGDKVTSCVVHYNTDDFIDSHFDATDEFDGNQKATLLTLQAFQEPEFLQWCLGKKNKNIRELMIKHWLLTIQNPSKKLSLQQLSKGSLKFNYNNKSGQFQKCFDKIKPRFDNPEISLDQWISENLVNLSQDLSDQKEQEAI